MERTLNAVEIVMERSGTTSTLAALPFMLLPTELRVLIYRCLDYKDLLDMRLVSRSIKSEIDEHMEFHIKLDQGYRSFRKLCRYRIRSCTLTNLTHSNLGRKGLFSFPCKLKKIVFDGCITQGNLLKILLQCKSIENLIFTHETLGILNILDRSKSQVQRCLESSFSKVKDLNMQLLRYPLDNPLEPDQNIESLLSLHLPRLRNFKLYFSVWGNWFPVLSFIERHANTLQEIDLQVGDRGDSQNTEEFLLHHPHRRLKESLNMKVLKTIKLKRFTFRDDVLHLNPSVLNIMLQILYTQKHLTAFHFHSPGDLSVSSLRQIVDNSFSTLTEVVVYSLQNFRVVDENDLNGIVEGALDMAIFSRCLHLRTLALSCISSHNLAGHEVMGFIRLFGLNRLPRSIERMHLTGFPLDVEELISLSTNSPSLKELLISDAGKMKYSTVLSAFLKNCPKLDYLNVRPVSTSANNDAGWWSEVSALSTLYVRFMGVSFDPIDDLEGFEAKISSEDRMWLSDHFRDMLVED